MKIIYFLGKAFETYIWFESKEDLERFNVLTGDLDKKPLKVRKYQGLQVLKREGSYAVNWADFYKDENLL